MLDKLPIANEDQKKGVEIVRHALKQPCYTIADNAGLDASVIVNKVSFAVLSESFKLFLKLTDKYGLNAAKDDMSDYF